MSRFFGYLQRHGVITTLVVLWAITLTTWVTWRVFGNSPPDVPASTAAAFATLFGLPALAVGLWKWKSERHDNR